MKKFLLIVFSFCIAFISTELFGQQSVVVTAFFDENGDGIDNDGFVAGGLTTAELILWEDLDASGTVTGADAQHNHTEVGGVYTFDDAGAGLPDGNYILQYIETPWTFANTMVGNATYAITLLNVGGATVDNDVDPIAGTSVAFNVSGGAMEMDIDLGLYFVTAIGDFVWEDLNGNGLQDGGEPGIAGVTVTLLDGTLAPAVDTDGVPVPAQVTDGVGNYVFGNLPHGDYIVEFSLPTVGGFNWYATTFDGTDPDFANDSDADPTNSLRAPVFTTEDTPDGAQFIYFENIDAGFFVVSSIGDLVFCDRNGNGIYDPGGAFPEGGIAGMDVQLVDAGGAVVDDADGVPLTTTTDGAGNYMFDLVRPGEYRVQFLFAGTLSDPPYEFTLKDDPNGLGDDTVDSDVDNNDVSPTYGMTDLFTVTSNDMEHETNLDAGIYKPFFISGTIWLDQNADNTNTGEAGPSGVLIELFQGPNKIDEFTTSAGEYEFSVPPGLDYQLFIGADNFALGGGLSGVTGCDPFGDAGDMVDNDDNGSNTDPGDVTSTVFNLIGDCLDNSQALVNYIDFCFMFECNQPNALASTACDEIPDINFICETPTLGTFCAIMPTNNSPGTQPNPLCQQSGGGTAHNITWFAFVAYDGIYDIVLTPTGCTGNDPGVQIGLYTDCTFQEEVYCNSGCSTSPVTISSNVLTPGQTYYWFIDGCFGSVCSYEVDINGDPIPPNLMPEDVCIVDPGTGGLICDETVEYCPDTEVTFQVSGLDLTVEFNWSISTLLDGPYDGDSNPVSEDTELLITFVNEGVYEVCLETIDNGCQVWNGPICRQITIEGLDDEEFADQTICEEDLPGFDLGIFNTDDPNGDGTQGWQAMGTSVNFGTVNGMVTTPEGCMYEQEFELMMFPPSEEGLFELTICEDELPFNVDAVELTELSFAGTLEFDLQDYLLVNSVDENMCDSTVDIFIELLDIQGGQFEEDELICVPEGIVMPFGYLNSISTDEEFITWEWFDPMMNLLPDDWQPLDPLNNIAPIEIGSGTYTLIGTVTKNGKMCTFTYTIDIDFDDFLPPTPTVDNPTIFVCEADSFATYTPIDFGDAFMFNWDFPNDVASSSTSGSFDEILTINWSGSAGGTVSLSTVNGCGESEVVEFDVTVVPQPTPMIDIVAEVCIDSCSVIEFMGDASDIASFVWDFDGGTENNGTGETGPGPHCVSWPDGGDKTITVSYTDNAGCVSTITTEVIAVTPPIAPPVVNCNPNTGEVSFTWDDVPGNLGYEVEVTSTSSVTGDPHTGTLDGTTFTVTGLEEGETVTIILTILTDDVCQMVSIASPGCTSQDCVAPSIDLMSDVMSFCLDPTTGTATITADVTSGENGTGVFSGPGIVDPDAGIFDPDSANIGLNTVTYVFMTDDPVPCIGNQTIQIEVLETPTASFTTDLDTICITESIQVTYDGTANANAFNWDYGVDGTGTGGANPTVSYTTPGVKMIELFVEKDGCPSESIMVPIFVQPELEPIQVNCSIQDLDQVEFSWNAVAGATGYLVTVNGGMPFETTDTSYGETGLDPDEVVSITVTVLTDSRCPGSSDDQECTAVSCPTFTFSYDEPSQDICVDGTNDLITLQADVAGGTGLGSYTWSGTNVVGDQFDPNGLPEGSYELFVTYQEDACEDSGSVMVNIIATPTADFSIDNNTICVGESVNILYEGSQLPDQEITWTSGGEDIVAGANDDEYIATFNATGTFDIELEVVNGICSTTPATASITVEPELVFDTINCVEDLNQIEFSWMTVDCASEYEVFIDGVSQGVQTETDYTVTDLDVGQEVTIEVIAVSGCACGNVMSTRICEAQECTPVDLSLSTMDGVQEFCISNDLTPVEIIAETPGSMGSGTFTWSGNGVDQDGMFDPIAAGVGTHTIVYDFIESPGCPYQDSITFIINDVPTVAETFEELSCYDQLTTVLEVIPGGGDGNYSITIDGNAADLMNDVEAGTYNILVTDGNQCTAESSVTITTPAEPSPSISGSTELIVGDSSSYSINSAIFAGEAIDSIVWTANGVVICNDPGCFSIGTQTPVETTVYEVTIYYNNNCSVSTTTTVEVNEPPKVTFFDISNIISPNGDGDNDVWVIASNDETITINSIKVFDRWGNMVWAHESAFRPFETSVTWDGKFNDQDLLPGVYVYFIEYSDDRLPSRVRSGDITLIE